MQSCFCSFLTSQSNMAEHFSPQLRLLLLYTTHTLCCYMYTMLSTTTHINRCYVLLLYVHHVVHYNTSTDAMFVAIVYTMLSTTTHINRCYVLLLYVHHVVHYNTYQQMLCIVVICTLCCPLQHISTDAMFVAICTPCCPLQHISTDAMNCCYMYTMLSTTTHINTCYVLLLYVHYVVHYNTSTDAMYCCYMYTMLSTTTHINRCYVLLYVHHVVHYNTYQQMLCIVVICTPCCPLQHISTDAMYCCYMYTMLSTTTHINTCYVLLLYVHHVVHYNTSTDAMYCCYMYTMLSTTTHINRCYVLLYVHHVVHYNTYQQMLCIVVICTLCCPLQHISTDAMYCCYMYTMLSTTTHINRCYVCCYCVHHVVHYNTYQQMLCIVAICTPCCPLQHISTDAMYCCYMYTMLSTTTHINRCYVLLLYVHHVVHYNTYQHMLCIVICTPCCPLQHI